MVNGTRQTSKIKIILPLKLNEEYFTVVKLNKMLLKKIKKQSLIPKNYRQFKKCQIIVKKFMKSQGRKSSRSNNFHRIETEKI